MKLKNMGVLILTLPLLIAGCSCNKEEIKNYKQVNANEAVNYVMDVKEAGNFDFTGYDFDIGVTLKLGEEQSIAENKGSASYSTTKEARFKYNTYLDGKLLAGAYLKNDNTKSTIYLNYGENKVYASVDNNQLNLGNNNLALSVPNINSMFDDEFFANVLLESSGWKAYKSVNNSSIFYKFELNDINEEIGSTSKMNYEFEFKQDKFVGANLYFLMEMKNQDYNFSFNMESNISRTDKEVEEPNDLGSYVLDQRIIKGNI